MNDVDGNYPSSELNSDFRILSSSTYLQFGECARYHGRRNGRRRLRPSMHVHEECPGPGTVWRTRLERKAGQRQKSQFGEPKRLENSHKSMLVSKCFFLFINLWVPIVEWKKVDNIFLVIQPSCKQDRGGQAFKPMDGSRNHREEFTLYPNDRWSKMTTWELYNSLMIKADRLPRSWAAF